jgi:hypothetical protein
MQGVVRIKFAPQSSDEHLDDVAVALEVLFVQVLGEIGLRDDLTGFEHQMLQQPVFERGQFDGRLRDGDGLRAGVEHDRAAAQLGARPTTAAAQQSLQTRQELFDMKRLAEVIVGTGLQALHFVLPVIARGQHQNRKAAVLHTPAADQFEPR